MCSADRRKLGRCEVEGSHRTAFPTEQHNATVGAGLQRSDGSFLFDLHHKLRHIEFPHRGHAIGRSGDTERLRACDGSDSMGVQIEKTLEGRCVKVDLQDGAAGGRHKDSFLVHIDRTILGFKRKVRKSLISAHIVKPYRHTWEVASRYTPRPDRFTPHREEAVHTVLVGSEPERRDWVFTHLFRNESDIRREGLGRVSGNIPHTDGGTVLGVLANTAEQRRVL